MEPMATAVTGLLLAAGEGRRFGMPKALVPGALARAVDVLREGGCERVVVVLGAAFERARRLVPPGVTVIRSGDWQEGMGASLRAGLAAIGADGRAEAVLVHLVDLPDVGPEVVGRVLAHASPQALARATYAGRPGHPVLLGREHWAGVAASAVGDRGARDYLRRHGAVAVPCDDLASGQDVDTGPA
jgi:nicotine blue oxidoreductase